MGRWLKRAAVAALVALAALMIYGGPSYATEAPYTVSAEGVTLTGGATFEAHGHVNYRTTERSGGVHFDPNNGQPGGAFIGQSFLPIDLEPGECIVWVQWSSTNYHYGENGEPPVCAPEPTPTPTPTPTPEPTPEPTPTVTPTPTPEPTPEPSVTPTPQPTPTEPVATPTPTPTATATPQPSPSATPSPVASGSVPPTERLADTGADGSLILWGSLLALGLALAGGGAVVWGVTRGR
jgi:type V secretory pathway adhesin AidA